VLANDRDGVLFASDANNNRISKIAPNGTVTLFAANVFSCGGMAFDAEGNLYVASSSGILKFTPDGQRTEFARRFTFPVGIAFDSAGDLYVADQSAGVIKRVTPDGIVHAFASGLALPQYVAIEPNLAPPALALNPSGAAKLTGGIKFGLCCFSVG
jgi:sugar lactone lactonase YvrE